MRQHGDKHTEGPRESRGLQAHWQLKAACRGKADTYFDPWEADSDVGYVNATAESYCKTCPVKRECLLAGLDSDRQNGGSAFGIWGGLPPKQRRALVRARFRAGCPVCHGELILSPQGAEWQACASCGVTWRRINRKPIPTGDIPPATVQGSLTT